MIFDWRLRVSYIYEHNSCTEANASLTECICLSYYTRNSHETAFLYILYFLEVILESYNILRRSEKIEDYKPSWRSLRYTEQRIMEKSKIWSKWIQLRNFCVCVCVLSNSCRAHLFIFLIHIRLFWLVITETFHLFEILQALFISKWTVILTTACISCQCLGTGVLTVFRLVALLRKPSFQFKL